VERGHVLASTPTLCVPTQVPHLRGGTPFCGDLLLHLTQRIRVQCSGEHRVGLAEWIDRVDQIHAQLPHVQHKPADAFQQPKVGVYLLLRLDGCLYQREGGYSPLANDFHVRAEQTKDGGLHGIYVSLTDMDLEAYELTTDGNGKELQRTKLPPPPSENIGIGGPAGGGAPRPAEGPAAAAAAPARPQQPRRRSASLGKPGEWNTVELIIENNVLNGSVNSGALAGGEVNSDGFGAIALHVTRGQMIFDDVGLKDINGVTYPQEATSSHFTKRRLSDFYYGWSAVAADTQKSGKPDVIAGPFIYLAPNYTEHKRYRAGRQYNPSLEYAPDMVNFAGDFNGDGWPDIISSDIQGNNRPLDFYINPKGESRRWNKSRAVDKVSTELVIFKDIDGDGKPEIMFGGNNVYAYAKPDPNDPTALWKITPISEKLDRINNHGMGVGDINGDGRLDFIVSTGWYEQLAPCAARGPWRFHENGLRRRRRRDRYLRCERRRQERCRYK
jgi:hypothetical protein